LALRSGPAVEISNFKNPKNVVLKTIGVIGIEPLLYIVNSLIKSGNKKTNINFKKLKFMHSVNGDGWKTAKSIKRQC